MKRKWEDTDKAIFGDILTATTEQQRAWIGAVVLAYNETERALHKLAGDCLGLIGIGPAYNVTSRINGADGLIAIIHAATSALAFSGEQAKLVNTALSGFAECKGLRDSVGHVELANTSTQTGTAPGKRGKKPSEVLLSAEALEGLYKRLVLVKKELNQLSFLFGAVKAIKLFELFGALDDQRRSLNEEDIRDATARCQSHQSQRLSLPPFPAFPEPPTQEQLLQQFLDSDEPNKSLKIVLERR